MVHIAIAIAIAIRWAGLGLFCFPTADLTAYK